MDNDHNNGSLMANAKALTTDNLGVACTPVSLELKCGAVRTATKTFSY